MIFFFVPIFLFFDYSELFFCEESEKGKKKKSVRVLVPIIIDTIKSIDFGFFEIC